MNILAFFTNSGFPATGLSPTIRIREVPAGTLVVTDAAMTEVGDGHYSYDFTAYNYLKDYAIRCDGGATLTSSKRYTYAGNENYIDLLLVKAQPIRPFQIVSNPLGLIFSTIGLVVMFPVTWKLTKSRYYQNLNKKEKGKLKKVIIAAFVLLSVTFLFYIF